MTIRQTDIVCEMAIGKTSVLQKIIRRIDMVLFESRVTILDISWSIEIIFLNEKCIDW